MNGILIYPAGNSPALTYACRELDRRGYHILPKPTPDTTHLLLPVPSFEPDGRIRGGGVLEHLLGDLPDNVTVIGGKLEHPALRTYETVDLLDDPDYTAENADITAECALQSAAAQLPVVFKGCQVLVLGWGRIGKCLAKKLKALGAQVTVAARRPSDRAMLKALDYRCISMDQLPDHLCRYRVIFNTVPAMVLPEEVLKACSADCLLIELASADGIGGKNVLQARGLPGKLAPESSGALIAKTVIGILRRKEGLA